MSILHVRQIREVFRYAQNFKEHIFVLYVDDFLLSDHYFNRIVQDVICLSNQGIRLIIVIGARNFINEIMQRYGRTSKFYLNKRIISNEDMELVQMASFDTAARVINKFAEFKKNTVMGNWITAKGLGVINGVDFLHAGKVASINTAAITKLLQDDIIPVIPAIGWSTAGKPYSLEAAELASKISIYMKADKIFYIGCTSPEEILKNLTIVSSPNIDIAEEGRILRMKREGALEILAENTSENNSASYYLLQYALKCLDMNIDRVHLIDGTVDGSLLEELFSPQGSGVMIHNDEYQAIRPLVLEQVEEVWNIMQPLVKEGILVERSLDELKETYQDYVCYMVDNVIYAIAAMHDLGEGYAEIAGVVVTSNHNKSGVGRKIIKYLIETADTKGFSELLVLTTTTGDWFETLGFEQTDVSEVPENRRKKYEKQNRGSRVYKYSLSQ